MEYKAAIIPTIGAEKDTFREVRSQWKIQRIPYFHIIVILKRLLTWLGQERISFYVRGRSCTIFSISMPVETLGNREDSS